MVNNGIFELMDVTSCLLTFLNSNVFHVLSVIRFILLFWFLESTFTVPRKYTLQKSNYEEALELLKMAMDSCKQLTSPLILFYDELSSVLDCRTPHPAIVEWLVI